MTFGINTFNIATLSITALGNMTSDKHKNSRMTTFRIMTPKHYDLATHSIMIFIQHYG